MSAEKPTLEEIVKLGAESIRNEMRVQIPCRVLAYDEDKQRVTILPVIRFGRLDAAGDRETYLPEPIANVPVAFFSAGAYSLTFPIVAGQHGMAMFSDRSLDEWLATGNEDITPADPRRFDISDAVYFPGVASFASPVPSDGVDGSAMVLRAPLVLLGSSAASDFVALSSLVEARLAAIKAAIAGAAVAAGDGGALFKTNIITALGVGFPASVAAAKVKAE